MKVLSLLMLAFFFSLAIPEGGFSQMMKATPKCPAGSPEAEREFQLALDYQYSRDEIPRDIPKAAHLFEQALAKGSSKAAIDLGLMKIHEMASWPEPQKRFDEAMNLFIKAAGMGCPEGYYYQGMMYYEGYGVTINEKKADKLLRRSAEEGSLLGMAYYGKNLFSEGKREDGKKWLQKALDAGYGDAGYMLSICYDVENDVKGYINALRQGIKAGSEDSLFALYGIYSKGSYDQTMDKAYAKKILDLTDQIKPNYPPPPIPNFDELVPPKPILPYTTPKLADEE